MTEQIKYCDRCKTVAAPKTLYQEMNRFYLICTHCAKDLEQRYEPPEQWVDYETNLDSE